MRSASTYPIIILYPENDNWFRFHPMLPLDRPRDTNTNAIIPVSLRGVLLRWDDEAISRKREIATLRSR